MNSNERLVLSSLNHTWILDLDGTILKHNGYKIDGKDSFLPMAREFILSLPKDDMVIFITSRSDKYRESTEKFLVNNGIRFNLVIYNAPYGERILINDTKESGLRMAYSVSVKRNNFTPPVIDIKKDL